MAEGTKVTLPWPTQYAGWLEMALFSPLGLEAFREAKPQMYEQIFGDLHAGINVDPNTGDLIRVNEQPYPESLWPYMRLTQEYNPWRYLGIDQAPQQGMAAQNMPKIGSGAAVGGGGGVGIGGFAGGGPTVPGGGVNPLAGMGTAGGGMGPTSGPGNAGLPSQQGLIPSGYQRPGGATQAEQDLLNNSYFGQVAPLQLGGAAQSSMNQQGLVNGIFSGQGPQDILGGLYGGPGGQQYQMPQMPMAPGMQGLVTPEMAASAPMGPAPQPLSFPPIQIPGAGQGPMPPQGMPPSGPHGPMPQGMPPPSPQQGNSLAAALEQLFGPSSSSLYGLGNMFT